MLILIHETVIETKDIADIVPLDGEFFHPQRGTGFKVIFIDNRDVLYFHESLSILSSTEEKYAALKEKWEILLGKVISQWLKDKTEIITLKL